MVWPMLPSGTDYFQHWDMRWHVINFLPHEFEWLTVMLVCNLVSLALTTILSKSHNDATATTKVSPKRGIRQNVYLHLKPVLENPFGRELLFLITILLTSLEINLHPLESYTFTAQCKQSSKLSSKYVASLFSIVIGGSVVHYKHQFSQRAV